ncbi:MAG TPA: hypothetical protein PLB00_15395, partial [Pseudomonadota bacterium]|nr:hypothetical protein [Pseudomonadota bacterium]
MPALSHPLTLEDRSLAANRRRAWREAWAQSLFVGGSYAVFAMLAMAAWLRLDPDLLAPAADWIVAHATALALGALVAAAWTMRRRLGADARRHAQSSHAALPVWRDAQR